MIRAREMRRMRRGRSPVKTQAQADGGDGARGDGRARGGEDGAGNGFGGFCTTAGERQFVAGPVDDWVVALEPVET